MTTYMCWSPDDDDDGENARKVEAVGPYTAAEMFAERMWSDWDHPTEMEICVRTPGGVVAKYTVEAEKTVTFTAFPSTQNDRLTAAPECGNG